MNDRPELQPERLRPQQERSQAGLAAKVVIAAAALLGTGYLASSHFGSSHSDGNAPALAPASKAVDHAASAPPMAHVATQLAMIAPENAPEALRQSNLTPAQRQEILAAVRRRDVRLVDMPLADATGQVGRTVIVSSAGIAQTVILSGKPRSVILPIRDAGEVSITPVAAAGGAAALPSPLPIVALTALGPQLLPSFTSADQQLILDVIAQ